MAISSKEAREARAADHYRRFKDYDYSRGAVVFVTFAVAAREPVFGRVGAEGRLIPSPCGLAVAETFAKEAAQPSGIELMKSVIMPDHVHLRLCLQPGIAQPLAKLAAFVRNFKRWAKWRGSWGRSTRAIRSWALSSRPESAPSRPNSIAARCQ